VLDHSKKTAPPAFCRFFAACVRAARTIMFDKTFRAGTKLTETRVGVTRVERQVIMQLCEHLDKPLIHLPVLRHNVPARVVRAQSQALIPSDDRHFATVAIGRPEDRLQRQVEWRRPLGRFARNARVRVRDKRNPCSSATAPAARNSNAGAASSAVGSVESSSTRQTSDHASQASSRMSTLTSCSRSP
jgi:hypothetical protein